MILNKSRLNTDFKLNDFGAPKRELINILDKKGHTLEDSKLGVEICHKIRSQKAIGLKGDYHPFAKNKTSIHPFNQKI